ncbi:peptide/nickel transport system substrate-binding protein [Raineyella antarctica]|uniref:Peptide/nickel transport system substrate-binding protein n=1 Tax=Raineyella antarctica TaxID=1577474 RepID=A0A1G6HI24_9ACTN|nr:ABC transporter substrate-binding protein [Raineyella antarctica]SDB93900.1 peptide/nickel transport system substrate-binding protein [Raineyella antarctica]
MKARVGAAALALGALLVSGCTPQPAPPAPAVPGGQQAAGSPSPTPTPRPDRDFTVGTTDAITTVDPAAMTTGASQAVAFSVFQRLMTTQAGDDVLKPDAARDCIFEQDTIYTCTLLDGLRFHSGAPVTSTDVKYSIERARRLNVPGSSAPQLAAISSIETPDPQTVRFRLRYPDTDIGYGLASPAASIVDPSAYPADRVADASTTPSGSGPYRYMASGKGVWTFARYTSYQGRTPASIVRVVLREYASSADLETAMTAGDVDAAWRGLDAAATTRQRHTATVQGDQSMYVSVVAKDARVIRLEWDRGSALTGNAALRSFVNAAVADRRTLTSIMPTGITGSREGLYPAGGRPTAKAPSTPTKLVLGYDPTMPDGADLAAALARSIEATKGATVTVKAGGPGIDLWLVDTRAATWTPRAWLQDYTQVTGAPHAKAVATMMTSGLTSSDQPTRTAATSTIQEYAAEDAYVTPLSQQDEVVFVRRGFQVDLGRLGPGWQLDLAAFSQNS